MKFGRLWFDGVVTDHDVSTDDELIWHVVFDDGDECDLNEAELTAVMLPLSASGTSTLDPAPTAGARLRHRSCLPPAALFTAASGVSSPTLAPTLSSLLVRGGRCDRAMQCPPVVAPHTVTHREIDGMRAQRLRSGSVV